MQANAHHPETRRDVIAASKLCGLKARASLAQGEALGLSPSEDLRAVGPR